MGYRSNVTYVFYTMEPDIIPFPLLKLWFDENYPKHDFNTVEMGDDYIKVSYVGVKWYESYPEVEAVREATEKFATAFEADDVPNAAWEMMRVGEETPDIEDNYSAYACFRLGVNREIFFD